MAVAERDLSQSKLTKPVFKDEEFKPQPYRWTREQFYELGDMGWFEGRRAILVEGEILAMPAMNDPHRTSLALAVKALEEVFGNGYFLSIQCPFDIRKSTDPEPDIAVIQGEIRDYSGRGLTVAELIVEISATTLLYDRHEKASLYALARVDEYWIVNIKGRQIEVHRQPAPDESQPYGHGYRERHVYQAGEFISPLNAAKPVAVADLLP